MPPIPTSHGLAAASQPRPVTGASILVIRDGKAVIVKRGKEPSKGLWALPGGKQEFGETLEEAARRELLEETGLTAGPLKLLQLIEPIRRDEAGTIISHYVLGVFTTSETSGVLVAGNDADAAAWVGVGDLDAYDFTPTSQDILKANLT